LYGHRCRDQTETAVAPALLEEHLVAFVTTALVDSGRATRELDWVTGHLVLTREREVMDVCGVAASFVRESNPRLMVWIEWLDLLSTTVGDPAQPTVERNVFATGVCGPVLLRGTVGDVVRHGDELIVVRDVDSFGLRRMRDALAGRPWVVELLRENPGSVRIPLRKVTRARLRAGRLTRVWTCDLDLPDRRVVLRGSIDAATVARALRAALGDLVTTRRVAKDLPAPGRHAHRPTGADSKSPSAMIFRWISEVPSKMVVSRASRQ